MPCAAADAWESMPWLEIWPLERARGCTSTSTSAPALSFMLLGCQWQDAARGSETGESQQQEEVHCRTDGSGRGAADVGCS